MKIEIGKDVIEGLEMNVLYVDGVVFDYLIDKQSLIYARNYSQSNPDLKKSVHGDIQKHFLDSLSEFIGKPITLEDLNKAIASGEI